MDITERKITKIAREAEKLVLLTMREEGVGTAEIDLIHAVRHHPGCTQAQLAELLHADKAAIARRTKNLEAKGLLIRRDAPSDRRSQLLYPTQKAESLRSSKAEIEAAFYEYLTNVLTAEEAAAFAAALNKLYTASKTESRAGFPHFRKAAGGELLPLNLQPHLFLFLDLGRQGADAAGHGQHGDESQRVSRDRKVQFEIWECKNVVHTENSDDRCDDSINISIRKAGHKQHRQNEQQRDVRV